MRSSSSWLLQAKSFSFICPALRCKATHIPGPQVSIRVMLLDARPAAIANDLPSEDFLIMCALLGLGCYKSTASYFACLALLCAATGGPLGLEICSRDMCLGQSPASVTRALFSEGVSSHTPCWVFALRSQVLLFVLVCSGLGVTYHVSSYVSYASPVSNCKSTSCSISSLFSCSLLLPSAHCWL